MVEEVSQPVSCTFSDCKQIFWNMGDMITHKINLKCHSYCLPCDLDFPSEQALYLHMITSNGHITCIHCGLEFRSQGGLGVHIQNNHNQVKRLPCTHCDATFGSASAVIMHIESGNCPLANEDGHRRDQVKPKAFGGKNILDMRHSNSSSDTETAEDGLSSEDNEQEGGVRLDLASSPAYQTPSAAFAQLSEQSFSADSSTDSSYDSLSENILAAPRSPDLECGGVPLYQQIPVFAPDSAGDGRYPSADPNELRYASILGAFEPPVVSLSTEGVVSAYQQSPVYAPGSSHDGRFPLTELKEQSGSSSLRKPLEQPTLTNTCLGTAAQGNPFLSGSIPKVADMSQRVMNAPLPSTTSHRKLSNVDPQQFWNAERSRFVCNCGTSYATAREFRTHITLDDDSTIKDCPRCFKRFGSLAALVAHVEAPHSRCNAFADDNVEDEINELTRGFATFRSHRDDLKMQEDLITMDISDENLKPITTAAQVDEDDELADELAGQI